MAPLRFFCEIISQPVLLPVVGSVGVVGVDVSVVVVVDGVVSVVVVVVGVVSVVVVVLVALEVVVVVLLTGVGKNALALTAIDICGVSLGLVMSMDPIDVPTTNARTMNASKPIFALFPNHSLLGMSLSLMDSGLVIYFLSISCFSASSASFFFSSS